MPIASVDEWRMFSSALCLHIAAASSKPTARWALCGVRQPTFDDLQTFATLNVNFWNRIEQGLGVRNLHICKKIYGGGLLNDFTGVHNRHIVGVVGDNT